MSSSDPSIFSVVPCELGACVMDSPNGLGLKGALQLASLVAAMLGILNKITDSIL